RSSPARSTSTSTPVAPRPNSPQIRTKPRPDRRPRSQFYRRLAPQPSAQASGPTKVVAMRVGVLTGGGDCPGLNAVIRAVVRKGVQEYGLEFVGFRDGWRGPLEGHVVPLDIAAVRGILPRGGTILGSSRTNPLKNAGGGRNGIER